ncbi:MAG: acyl-CoA dehydrogenase family protein [Deltaproteobacteria bacterium]|nr:acyl-CoA dehydrogenase family protein [Candidatus Anaeroferrophillus wilburensis]MBN2890031.1 acyl-CoA dehydrogenase family protein [Deltaproteobacteria bacterium]
MNFDLTEEQEILRKSVRSFAEKEIAPVAQELDEREEFSLEVTRKMADLGLFGMFVSPEYGGSGLDYVSYIIAVEEIARVDGSQAATVAAGNSLGIGPIYYFGSEEQKKKWLPPLCSGEMLAAFGLTEANAGSDAGNSKTNAVLDGDEWVINGSKIFITNASTPITGVIVVQAVTGTRPDGRPEMSCILVPAGSAGLDCRVMHKKMMWRASNTTEIYFDDCRVPKENLLGKRGDGFHMMLSTLDGGRLSIGSMGLGGAQGAFEKALRYAGERNQFGRPLLDFQVTQFKLADMAMEIELARNLLYKACWLRDNKRPFSKEAAMAKLYCSETMGRVVNHAVQIHGGYGLMKEYDVERFYRDQKLLDIGEGTSEVQRIVVSRLIR